MLCRRNAVSTKCCVDEVLCRRSAVSTKCCVDEVLCRRSAVSTKIFRRNTFRRSILSTKCCVGENFSTKICRPSACRRIFLDQQHIYPTKTYPFSRFANIGCNQYFWLFSATVWSFEVRLVSKEREMNSPQNPLKETIFLIDFYLTQKS
jgi:hypothetical protein